MIRAQRLLPLIIGLRSICELHARHLFRHDGGGSRAVQQILFKYRTGMLHHCVGVMKMFTSARSQACIGIPGNGAQFHAKVLDRIMGSSQGNIERFASCEIQVAKTSS